MVHRGYVGVAKESAMEVGEKVRRKVQASAECVLGDGAVEVVFD